MKQPPSNRGLQTSPTPPAANIPAPVKKEERTPAVVPVGQPATLQQRLKKYGIGAALLLLLFLMVFGVWTMVANARSRAKISKAADLAAELQKDMEDGNFEELRNKRKALDDLKLSDSEKAAAAKIYGAKEVAEGKRYMAMSADEKKAYIDDEVEKQKKKREETMAKWQERAGAQAGGDPAAPGAGRPVRGAQGGNPAGPGAPAGGDPAAPGGRQGAGPGGPGGPGGPSGFGGRQGGGDVSPEEQAKRDAREADRHKQMKIWLETTDPELHALRAQMRYDRQKRNEELNGPAGANPQAGRRGGMGGPGGFGGNDMAGPIGPFMPGGAGVPGGPGGAGGRGAFGGGFGAPGGGRPGRGGAPAPMP
jgi:hypothetical protein